MTASVKQLAFLLMNYVRIFGELGVGLGDGLPDRIKVVWGLARLAKERCLMMLKGV